jgi:hypothetical protein
MRSIVLLGLIIIAISSAEPPPPPPPQIMNIYMKDNTENESFLCANIDPDVGVTFDKTQMKVEIRIVDPNTNAVTARYGRFFCISQIDSITFSVVPAPEQAPGPAGIKRQR